MKKIYSFLLIATALLFSTNLKAADQAFTVSSSEWSDAPGTLKYALDQALANSGHTTTITLNENVDIPGTYNIYFGSVEKYENSKIVLKLNGHTISNSAATTDRDTECPVFRLFNGTLDLQGTGTISSPSSELIQVYGYRDDKGSYVAGDASLAHFEASEENKNIEYSVLNVGEKVTLLMTGKERAIAIYYVKNYTQSERDNCLGALPEYHTQFLKKENTNNLLSYGQAMGVRVNVDGKVLCPEGQRAIQVKGNILESQDQYYTESAPKTHISVARDDKIAEPRNFPVINVNPSAIISCSANATNVNNVDEDSPAIYIAGYAIVNLKGEISGCVGVYAKAGKLTFDGATVTSTATYTSEVVHHIGAKGGAGTAIVFDNNTTYTAPISSLITGNTVVNAGEMGSAIVETKTSKNENIPDDFTHIADGDFVIEGGTFNSGAEGCLNITATLTGNIQTNGTITGGTYDADITDIIGTATGIVTQFTNEAGETYYAISAKEDGQTWEHDLLNAGAKSLVQLDDNVTLADANDEIEVKYLSIPAGDTVTIPNGKTLIAGEIVLGNSTSVIKVEAGGKLIVNSQNGIISNFASSIVIEASENAQGILLLSPAATSNTHPKATVNYVASSYKVGPGEFVFQFMGHPMYNGSVTEVSMAPAGTVGFFNVWNGTTYDKIGYINSASTPQASDNLALFNRDFGFYALQTNNAQGDKPTVTFKGQVNGNNDAALRILNKWTTASNGYLGYIDNEAILSAVSAWGATPYVYQYYIDENGDLKWQAKGSTLRPLSDIAPMEPMMFYRDGAQDVTLDYSALVWNPATGEAVPAPSRATNDMTMATINVKGEGCEDEVIVAQTNEEGAPKYLSGKLNLYVSAEEKMDIYTAEDLNNTLIGYQVAKAGVYTMTFNNVQGNALTLVDLANGAQVNIEEGATYTFAASANETNDARFQIVEARKMPTDVETIESAKAQKGIYSLVGAYLGEDFDVLPAGIYVVNGVKVVK